MKARKPRSLLLQPWLLFCFALLNSCSPVKLLTHNIQQELKTSPAFQNSFSGLSIYDPAKQKMLFSHNPEKYFVPASNIKLYTYYTAQKLLRDSVAGISYTIKNDSLIFSGTGDPSFLNLELPESPVFDFLKNSEKKLFYQPSITSEPALGPGWSWDDYNYSFSAERSEFPIFGNLARFSFSEQGEFLKVWPPMFRDSIVLTEKQKGPKLKRAQNRNLFYISQAPNKNRLRKVPFRSSPELILQLLKDTLNRDIGLLPKESRIKPEKILYSVPTDSLYKKMLQDSDNFIAEQLLMIASQRISDTISTQKIIEHSKKAFLNDLQDAPRWVDASGLSRYNLVTPRSTIHLLEKMKQEIGTAKLFQLMPAGGMSGTIKDMFSSNQPYVYAKSGSMSNIYNLSGYLVTKSGKILIFSFMNNNFTGSSSILKREIEQILTQLRNNY